jgi:hypothetical protein
MGTMLEPIESAIMPEPGADAEVQPVTIQSDDTVIGTRLGQAINTLWSDHIRLSADHKKSARELRQVRLVLAERLHAMKSLLSRPGRNGQWRSWLRERGIARTTADRLVARHAETLGADNENVPTGAIPASIHDGEGAKLAEHLWPDLKNILSTNAFVIDFIGGIARVSGINHQWRSKGVMIFHPVTRTVDELPGTAFETEPASTPSDDADPNADVPAAEPVMATTGVEQIDGDGDNYAGVAV